MNAPSGPPAAAGRRTTAARVWLSGAAIAVSAVAAVIAAVAGYGFFAVALAVLAVFAAVDLSTVRRHGQAAGDGSAPGAGDRSAGDEAT